MTMHILLIGATGYVGSALLSEALDRGHHVTALVRDITRLPVHDRVSAMTADIYDAGEMARAASGRDAVISAFSPGLDDPDLRARHVAGSRAIIDGARATGVRLLVVGGAGSLEVAPGVDLVDAPDFPPPWKEIALASRDVLHLLRAEEAGLQWTLLSPPMLLEPGPRTGRYQAGGDAVLFDDAGDSRISLADYAVAMLDELEAPRHEGRRFTVAW